VRISATILSLMLLVGLSLAAQTTATNVSYSAGFLSSVLPPHEAGRGPGSLLSPDAIGDTLRVDLDTFDNAVGLDLGGIFYAAARLSPTKACTVATVIFYKWDASYDDYLYVWGKGTNTSPGQLIESVPYSGAITMAWQTVNLPVLVPLADNKDDIWVGPRINHAAGTHPLGIDNGPAVTGRGGWINADGRWVELSSIGFDANWHIRALLGHGAIPTIDVGVEAILAPRDTESPGPISPKVRIRNFGANPVNNIPLFCQIDSSDTTIFMDTANYTGPFAPSDTVTVTFPKSWTGKVGSTYKVTIYTALPEDRVRANDTLSATVNITPSEAVNEHDMKLGASFDNVLPTLGHDRVRINFTVARRGAVNLGVYDAAGLLVRTLVNGTLASGSQSATWDRTNSNGRRVANGAYFYRLTMNGKTVSSKSVLFN
jgi:hypothetical protein